MTFKSSVNMPNQQTSIQVLSDLYYAALNAVNGQNAVEQQLHKTPIEGNIAILAVGKAASAMMAGAKKVLSEQIHSALIITKVGHADHTLEWPCLETGHPIPNQKSLDAGAKLLEFLNNIPKNTKLLALISGGASALVEILPNELDLNFLQKLNEWLLASGLSIHEMNRIRQLVSLIKGGKALNYLNQDEMIQFLISDVKEDDISIIGSGLFVAGVKNPDVSNQEEQNQPFLDTSQLPDWLKNKISPAQSLARVSVESHIIANNEMACQAVISRAKQSNYSVTYHGQTLYGEALPLSGKLVKVLRHAESGVHIWGGEPSLVLPEKQGRGGRNQHLALAIAAHLENTKGMTVLVGATDGTDGPTDDAGAIVDAGTLERGAHCGRVNDYLMAADAGTFLAEAGDLISTGPTGTNVMDLVIAIKEPI